MEYSMYTENGALGYAHTGSANLNMFANLVRNATKQKIEACIAEAWNEDPELCLKVLFNLRDPRKGKGEKEIFVKAMEFLRSAVPNTFELNMNAIYEYGCCKDYLKLGDEVCLKAFAKLLDQNNWNAAKWAPTERCHFDKERGTARKLAQLLYPEVPVRAALKSYRKKLSGIREEAKVLERLESDQKWDEINFEHVPSIAMKKQRNAFRKHTPDKFSEYMSKVKQGSAKLNTGVLGPHDIVSEVLRNNCLMNGSDAADRKEFLSTQWDALVKRFLECGRFDRTMAIVDVSGSMSGTPMDVAISLGLLVSELTSEHYRGQLITFSQDPCFHQVSGSDLFEKVRSIRGMNWGMNTDFIAVFERILSDAVQNSLKTDEMIKTLFVFTDMQFDQASSSSGSYETTYEIIRRKYELHGYEMPQIVFWNLRNVGGGFPVDKNQPGVALMSGFSAQMLRLFLEDRKQLSPVEVMLEAVMDYKVSVHADDLVFKFRLGVDGDD
jgi:hypothetical protein